MGNVFLETVLPVIGAIVSMVVALYFGVSIFWAAVIAFPGAFVFQNAVGWILAITLLLWDRFK
jgi:hypothetical protein